MGGLADDSLQTRRHPFGIAAKIEQKIFSSITGYVNARDTGHNEIQQFAYLENITLAADTLRSDFVAFQKNGITPINHLEAVIIAIPEQVLGIHIVVDNIAGMGCRQQ